MSGGSKANSAKKSSGEIKKNLQFIKCECGTIFLLIPDAKQMGHIIEAHAAEHGKKEQDPSQAKAKTRQIQDLLLDQVIEKTSTTE